MSLVLQQREEICLPFKLKIFNMSLIFQQQTVFGYRSDIALPKRTAEEEGGGICLKFPILDLVWYSLICINMQYQSDCFHTDCGFLPFLVTALELIIFTSEVMILS